MGRRIRCSDGILCVGSREVSVYDTLRAAFHPHHAFASFSHCTAERRTAVQTIEKAHVGFMDAIQKRLIVHHRRWPPGGEAVEIRFRPTVPSAADRLVVCPLYHTVYSYLRAKAFMIKKSYNSVYHKMVFATCLPYVCLFQPGQNAGSCVPFP